MSGTTIVFSTEEHSVLQGNAPSFAMIAGLLRPITGQGLVDAAHRGAISLAALNALTVEDWGGWVGPSPRVTRPQPAVALNSFTTRVAWLWTFGDTPAARANYTLMVEALKLTIINQLASQSGDWSVPGVAPYVEAVNGPLSWWASGQASITTTQDVFPELIGRLGTPDNPVGPTTDANHPLTIGQSGQNTLQQIGETAKAVGIGVLCIGIAYVGWKLFSNTTTERVVVATRRQNPAAPAWTWPVAI